MAEGGRAACCLLPAVSGEQSQSTGRYPLPPAHSPSHRNWLNWLRLLISIKAFNRQAPQTAGNILFIWGFCLHNRQASRQRIISTTPLHPSRSASLRHWYTLNCPPGPVACELRREIFAPNFLLSPPVPLPIRT